MSRVNKVLKRFCQGSDDIDKCEGLNYEKLSVGILHTRTNMLRMAQHFYQYLIEIYLFLKPLVTLNIFAHNIAIKRYFNNKSKYCSDISKSFQTMIVYIQTLVFIDRNKYFQFAQEKNIGFKISFYLFIAISF